ncbi:hypothetical protein [Glutamicibacter ardleyensis]|uniref:Uncharacterized protein n=1 Tax=Glutamicibacter ardleyensis TaxID=225894 RepID=A0ABQ2DGP9_9MICC|nr:hypothetical protein [Glutamicibacter ardleyensis]GGJ55920.1 hypothetical protein GCM10007173_13470 [Glutamicibacter ardleyensis]
MIPTKQPARGLHIAGLVIIFTTTAIIERLPYWLASIARRMETAFFEKDQSDDQHH